MTDFRLTQAAVEQWAAIIPPNLQLTQTAVEEWAAISVVNPQMALTQSAIEQWASVAALAQAQKAGAVLLAGL